MAFLIWSIVALGFATIGISCFIKKQPQRFWANDEEPIIINDVRNYNRAMGKLWLGFSVVFLIVGLPLLAGQNKPIALLSIPGCMFLVIVVMLIGSSIEDRYRQ